MRKITPSLCLTLLLAMAAPCAGGIERLPGAADCAARDLALVIMVEEWGIEDATSQRAADVGLTLMRARETCSAGRVVEALTIYDSVLLERFTHAAR